MRIWADMKLAVIEKLQAGNALLARIDELLLIDSAPFVQGVNTTLHIAFNGAANINSAADAAGANASALRHRLTCEARQRHRESVDAR